MRRFAIALVAVLCWPGCDSGGGTIRKGDEVAFRRNSGDSNGKGWLASDQAAFRDMGKPPAEFDKLFDRLVAEDRIFEENYSAHAVVLETKFLGTKAARIRIKDGLNPGREAWCPAASLVRPSKP